MLHWPDSMFTYVTARTSCCPTTRSASITPPTSRFNDQVDQEELYEEALKYYANILTPFSDQVLKKRPGGLSQCPLHHGQKGMAMLGG